MTFSTQPSYPLIGVSNFVRRQTLESRHNHFDGSWEELTALVTQHWAQRQPSPHNPGVSLVPMPQELLPRFFSSLVEITPDTPLQATFAPRAAGEDPFVQIVAPGYPKSPARRAEIIVYSHDILAADGDAPEPQQAEHYIVSINAYATEDEEPMHPMTMARNFLHMKGGTQPPVPYTAEEFARAIVFWSRHARIG
jgi:hypothetical protein